MGENQFKERSGNYFFLAILLYGFGALLIREIKVRWKLQWSVIFFNPGWEDLGVLAGYGMYLGVQWPWTIMLIFFHATISTLIPIKFVDLLWPDYKDKPLIGKRGMIVSLDLYFLERNLRAN